MYKKSERITDIGVNCLIDIVMTEGRTLYIKTNPGVFFNSGINP